MLTIGLLFAIILFSALLFVLFSVFVTHGVADYWIDMRMFPFVWEGVFALVGALLSIGVGSLLIWGVLG